VIVFSIPQVCASTVGNPLGSSSSTALHPPGSVERQPRWVGGEHVRLTHWGLNADHLGVERVPLKPRSPARSHWWIVAVDPTGSGYVTFNKNLSHRFHPVASPELKRCRHRGRSPTLACRRKHGARDWGPSARLLTQIGGTRQLHLTSRRGLPQRFPDFVSAARVPRSAAAVATCLGHTGE